MSHDRVTAVYDPGIIPALIEHTHIESEHVCHVNGTAHAAFIRTDDHHVVGINI